MCVDRSDGLICVRALVLTYSTSERMGYGGVDESHKRACFIGGKQRPTDTHALGAGEREMAKTLDGMDWLGGCL